MSATAPAAATPGPAARQGKAAPKGKGKRGSATNVNITTDAPVKAPASPADSPDRAAKADAQKSGVPPAAAAPPPGGPGPMGAAANGSSGNFRFDFFGSNNSLNSLSGFSSFGSLPSLPSLPGLMDNKQKTPSDARDVPVTASAASAAGADGGRLVSGGPGTPPSAPQQGAMPSQQQIPPSQQSPPQRGGRPLPPLQPLPSQQPPQPSSPQSQAPAQAPGSPGSMNQALVSTQNQNRRMINPVTVPNGQNFVDITEYLNMPQSEAAKKLSIPPSTLSKRWKEAVRNRKWPWRVVCKLDKEIMTLLHNVPQGAPIPEEIEGRLGYLMRKRQEELKPVVIRL